MEMPMNAFSTIVRRVSTVFDYIAAVVLFGNCLLVVLNVITRSPLFESPIFGVYELVCYLSLVSVSLALANCSLEGGHTNLTFLMEKLPVKVRAGIEIAADCVVLVNFVLITWNIGVFMVSRFTNGEVSPVMRIPLNIIIAMVLIGFIPLTLAAVVGIADKTKTISTASASGCSSGKDGAGEKEAAS